MFEMVHYQPKKQFVAPPWMNSIMKNEKPVFNSRDVAKVTTEEELKGIRSASRAAAEALRFAVELTKTCTNGHDLDVKLTEEIIEQGGYPSGIGFMGFPKSVCISPNDVLVHGIPTKAPFNSGDWMNLDVTVFKDGFFGDNSTTVTIGEVDPEISRLVS